jgi:membrane protein DedA with SNARE-associated domain
MEYVTYFVCQYGYLAILILLMPGVFGIPLPDELLLTLIGYLALRGDLRLLPALAVVAVGTIIGLTVDYGVGRVCGGKMSKDPGAIFGLGPERFQRLQERLHRHGGWVLGLGYFVPGVRHWVAIAAGIIKFPPADFALFAYAGALAWSLLYIFLGYFLGQEAGLWAKRLGAHCQLAAGLIAALLLGGLLWRGKWLRSHRPKIFRKPAPGYSLKR